MDEFDHVVVGAGIVGAATALALARAGARVALVEADVVAAGASGGPGKRGVRSNARHPAELALAADALRRWPGLARDLGGDPGFTRIGGIELFDRDAVDADGGEDRLRVKCALQSRLGVASRVLTRNELEAELPGIGSGVSHGILVEADGVCSPAHATRVYADAAVAAGVDLREGWRVERIEEDDAGTTLHTTRGAVRATHAVALCANGATRALVADAFGVDVPLWEVAFHAQFLAPETPWVLPRLIGHDSRKLAAKTVDDGVLQVSGYLTAPWDDVTGRSRADEAMFDQSERTIRDVFPDLPPSERIGREGRREACTPDGLQFIDAVPGSRRVYLAAGWSGHGFATAPAVGPALAEWMGTGRRPAVLAAFGLARWSPS